MLSSLNLLKIQSDDIEVRRKGSLLQGLILLIVSLSVIQSVFEALRPGSVPLLVITFQGLASFFFGLICLFIIRQGHLYLAAHLFFATLNLVFFVLLITTTSNFLFPYLMLISIVAIATVVSVRASVFYSILTFLGVSAFYIFSEAFSYGDVWVYLVTCLGITVTAWATADYSQKALDNSKELTQELLLKSLTLERQANQLQLSTEIAQKQNGSQEVSHLLKEITTLLKSHFDFTHVAIFLVDEEQGFLFLQEIATANHHERPNFPPKISIDDHSIVGSAALHREPLLVNDTLVEKTYSEESFLPDTRSELALPLLARGELLGVLDLCRDKPGIVAQEDKPIFQIIANQIAINIDNLNLFAKTQTSLEKARIFYEYNTMLSDTLDVGELYRRAARAMSTWLDSTRCTIYSWNEDEQTVTAQADFWVRFSTKKTNKYSLNLPTLNLGQHEDLRLTLESGQPHLHQPANPGSVFNNQEKTEEDYQPVCLDIALRQGGQTLGLVRLYRQKEQPTFTDSEIQVAQGLARETAVSLARAILTSETQARVAQLRSLNRLSQSLSEAPDLEWVYKSTRREILSLVEATGLAISLLEEDEQHISLLYLYDYGREIDLSTMSSIPIEIGFTGYVARTSTTLHIHATPQNQAKFNSFRVSTTEDFNEFWLGLPLIVTNKLIGVLSLQNLEPFRQRDIELLTTIAGTLAISINNLLQLEAVQTALAVQFEQRLQIQTAAEIATATTSILEMDTLVQRAVELIKDRFGLYYVGLFLVENGLATLKAGTGKAGEVQLAAGRQLEVGGQSLIGGATNDGRPRITQDVAKDPEWLPNPSLPDTRSELALPLRVREKTIGALTVQSTEINVFSEDLIGSLQIMGDQLAVAIENAQLLAKAEARARRQAYLNQISAQLHQSADVEAIIGIGLRALSAELDGAAVVLQLGRRSAES